MCQQVQIVNNTNNQQQTNNKMKTSYSIKQVLKMLFKKQQKQQQQRQQQQKRSNSLESLESLDNLRNAQLEQEEEQFYEEIEDNSANEKIADMASSSSLEEVEQDIYVPVRFARTTAGTFFWTTNLQPVISTITPAADEDLLQPAYCYSNCQYPHMQYQQDRWAQA